MNKYSTNMEIEDRGEVVIGVCDFEVDNEGRSIKLVLCIAREVIDPLINMQHAVCM